MKKTSASTLLLSCFLLLWVSPLSGQEYGGLVPPETLKKMGLELAELQYKSLVDLWAEGKLTVAQVQETKQYMPPQWYENLMKLALCPDQCDSPCQK